MLRNPVPSPSPGETSDAPKPVGPILFARGGDRHAIALRALCILHEDQRPTPLIPDDGAAVKAELAWQAVGMRGWHYDFSLPARSDAGYTLDGGRYEVAADLSADLRVAFVSCNGRERGGSSWPSGDRDAMWRRLREHHRRAPFSLLLHGGDQIYADDVLAAHPEIAYWRRVSDDASAELPYSDEAAAAANLHLMRRYTHLYSREPIAWLLARVPALMMWDDHDIFDGWGSHPVARLDSPIGKGLFENARRFFLRMQLGASDDAVPPMSLSPEGESLSYGVQFPGLQILAPDLRSERRPYRIMTDSTWQRFHDTMGAKPKSERLLILSTVPALGPRLSWVEAIAPLIPRAREFRDDLRDQWQSRAHRAEWQRFLSALIEETRERDVTVLSGEIHLATHGEMDGHSRKLHQLVASGVAHPPPAPGYAAALSLLARIGENPLPKHPIRLHPLPGRRRIYTPQRNVLLVARRGGNWSAQWDLERSGLTQPLDI